MLSPQPMVLLGGSKILKRWELLGESGVSWGILRRGSCYDDAGILTPSPLSFTSQMLWNEKIMSLHDVLPQLQISRPQVTAPKPLALVRLSSVKLTISDSFVTVIENWYTIHVDGNLMTFAPILYAEAAWHKDLKKWHSFRKPEIATWKPQVVTHNAMQGWEWGWGWRLRCF